MPPKRAKGPRGRVSKKLPSENGMNDMTNDFNFHRFPTDDNLASWADAAAPRAGRHQAAALKHHVEQTAVGVVSVMEERGFKPRPADNRLQRLLHELRNAWPNGQWYPNNFAPTSSPPTLGLVKAMVAMTNLWQSHRPGMPLNDLWNQTKGSQGVIIRAIFERQNQVFTRPAAQAALKMLKDELGITNAQSTPEPAPAPAPELPRGTPKAEFVIEDKAVDDDLSLDLDFNLDNNDQLFFSFNELGSPPLPPARTPSPPPLPPPRKRPEVPKDLIIAHLFSRPGMPVRPTTEATLTSRLKGLEKAFRKQLRADASTKAKKLREDSRRHRQEARTSAAAAVSKTEIAEDLVNATVRFLAKRVKTKYGQRLSAKTRGMMSRMFRAAGKKIMSKLEL
ncbi:hypothetical protein ColTof4_14459 [Colletotrichum tofieldiae]|nr:hypothetical protein ColTof4_14459 [Colletotrichum tofieldiae]